MWGWDTDVVNRVHKLRYVEDLHLFPRIIAVLIDEIDKSAANLSAVSRRIGLSYEALNPYILQGTRCQGQGGWCAGGNCLGRFNLWCRAWTYDNQHAHFHELTVLKNGDELLEDFRNNLSEAGMLKICLKTIPQFLEFCEILSHGAKIVEKDGVYSFQIDLRGGKIEGYDGWQLTTLIYKRMQKRLKKTEIPYDAVELPLLILWCKNLGLIRRDPTFNRMKFEVGTFEGHLEIKRLHKAFLEDREELERFL